MNIGITSIQRDRGKWIVEWLAFHMLAGFNRFFIYSHKCADGMTDTLKKLAQHYPITVHELSMDKCAQNYAYQHSADNHLASVDWMAFIDGDEFLYPTSEKSLEETLRAFEPLKASAMAAYWVCYGSNGHLRDPDGLIIEDYPRHSAPDFLPNRHVKSIVRGGEKVKFHNAHIFHTARGTVDELQRPVTSGWEKDKEPSYKTLRINHYAVQSRDFFMHTKRPMGRPDSEKHWQWQRPVELFDTLDRNECDDGVSYGFLEPLKAKIQELRSVLDGQ